MKKQQDYGSITKDILSNKPSNLKKIELDFEIGVSRYVLFLSQNEIQMILVFPHMTTYYIALGIRHYVIFLTLTMELV